MQLGSHDRNIRDTSADNQTDLIAKFDTGTIRHTLLLGAEVGHDTYANQGFTRNGLPVVSLDNPVYEATPSNVTTTPGNVAQSTSDTEAAYFNDTLELTEHWKAVGGLRWDRFEAKLTNTPPPGGTLSSTTLPYAAQTVYYDSVRGGLIYQPSQTQSYYVSYGTSFDPSLEYLTATAGQQNLPPEENRSYEAGAKWDLLGGGLSLTSALFQIKQTNARAQVSTGVYELVGTERVNGAEVTATGHLTSKWQVFGGYTYLDPKIVCASALDGTQGKVCCPTRRATTPPYGPPIPSAIPGMPAPAWSTCRNASPPTPIPWWCRAMSAGTACSAYHQAKYEVRPEPAQYHQRALLRLADPVRFRPLRSSRCQAARPWFRSPTSSGGNRFMLLQVPALLDARQIQQLRQQLEAASWVDGRVTAGHQSGRVKQNQQLAENTPLAQQLGDVILGALERNPLFISAVLPNRVYPPLFPTATTRR